jgi:hypothetical protein
VLRPSTVLCALRCVRVDNARGGIGISDTEGRHAMAVVERSRGYAFACRA